MLDPKVAAARLFAVERVDAHQLRELEEVGDATGALELLIELFAGARDMEIRPELVAELRDELERGLQPLGAARHPAILPHDLAELAMERRRRALATDGDE